MDLHNVAPECIFFCMLYMSMKVDLLVFGIKTDVLRGGYIYLRVYWHVKTLEKKQVAKIPKVR